MSGTDLQMAMQQRQVQPSMQGYRPAPNPYAQMPQLNQMQGMQMPMPNPMAARFNGGQMQPVPPTPWGSSGMPMGSIQESVQRAQAQANALSPEQIMQAIMTRSSTES